MKTDVREALNTLGLSEDSTLSDLNYSFRRLAKQYHPDSNPGREKWAHGKMTRLNLAYEVALEYIASCKEKEEKTAFERLKRSFLVEFNHAMNQVLDGVYIFYQYGLENPHMRKGGVRRLRYRDSIKALKGGITRLEQLENRSLVPGDLSVFISFSKAFLQNVLLDRHFIPSSDGAENIAYRHYREGSGLLDSAIKQVFFGDLLTYPVKGSVQEFIDLSNSEFMAVLTRYYTTGWVAETVMKIYLLDLLGKVMEVFRRMRY
jgi:hypothetical protein